MIKVSWQECFIGSCQRHKSCMYTPCRSSLRIDGVRTGWLPRDNSSSIKKVEERLELIARNIEELHKILPEARLELIALEVKVLMLKEIYCPQNRNSVLTLV